MSNTTLQSTDDANIPLMTGGPVEPVNRYEYTPRSFKEIPLLWLKIFKMDVTFFENEIRHTSAINTLLGVLLYSCIYSLLQYSLSYLNSVLVPIIDHPIALATWRFELSQNSVPYNAFIRTPLVFYSGGLFLFISAKIFRGKGTFNEQIYLTSIYSPLISYFNTIGQFIKNTFPIFFVIVFLPWLIFMFFSLVLSIRSYKTVHAFSTGKVLAIFFGSTVVLLFLYFIYFVLFLAP